MKALALAGGNFDAARAYAASQNWPDADMLLQKTAVGGLESSGTGGLAQYAERDFLQMAWPMSLVGRLVQARRASFVKAALQQTARAAGAWTPEGGGIGLSLPAVTRLSRTKVCAGIVTTAEAIAEGSEEALSADLARAVAYAVDLAFVDGASGDASRPAGVTAGAATVTSSGDVAADVNEALVVFQGELSSAAWLCHPATAAAAALQLGVDSLGALGGRLAGLPCYVSEAFDNTSSDGGELVLLDQRALQLAGGDQVEMRITNAALVEMKDNPAGNTIDPASATSEFVSMFQSDSLGGADYARFAA